MSVRKDERETSKMEFIKNAKRIRKDVTDWLFRDFGQSKKKTINHVIKNITPEDQELMNNIFAKYDVQSKYTFTSDYPDWFINYEREQIIEILRNLSSNISHGNSIYATNISELNLRRNYQDAAIGDCFDLINEIQNVAESISFDLNKLSPIIESIQKEINLLKGWRQSDNKIRKKLEKEEKQERSLYDFWVGFISCLVHEFLQFEQQRECELQ